MPVTSFLEATQMDGLAPEAKAKKALQYVLDRIRDEPHVGWYLGQGSQCFDLLTEAYATIAGIRLRDVREGFACPNPANPRGDTA